ncbi:hypothetical protein D1007_29001 [Hordeum vulgare]|nr:hypothetical protein D1007_29001 [Hordeum vulgare]
MKTMPIRSNLHWVAYKEVVASSTIKSLEVFASKVAKVPLFEVDLNQTLVEDVKYKVEVEANEYPKYEFGGSAPINDDDHDLEEEYERQHNIVGDVEAQVRHKDMDPDIIYQRACVDDSHGEGPMNELDEDGFTEKEAEWYAKITSRDHKVPLFCDVSLTDKAIVDDGMSKTIEARQFPSSTPNEILMSYLRKDGTFLIGGDAFGGRGSGGDAFGGRGSGGISVGGCGRGRVTGGRGISDHGLGRGRVTGARGRCRGSGDGT